MAVVLTIVVAVMLLIIGVGLGATMTKEMLSMALKSKKAFAIGVFCQYGLMPPTALLLSKLFNLPTDYALGLVLVGSAPGGTTSNLFALWCGCDVALSVAMSAFSTCAAFGLLPLCIYVYGNLALGLSADSMPWGNIAIALVLCIFPASGGAAFRHWNPKREWRGRPLWKWLEMVGSGIGAVVLLAAVVLGIATHQEIFSQEAASLWVAVALLEPLGAAIGFGLATLLRLPLRQRCTIALETGVQNSVLIIALIELSFQQPLKDRVMRAALIFALLYIVHSVWLVLLFRHLIRRFDPAPADGQPTLDASVSEQPALQDKLGDAKKPDLAVSI